MNKIIPKIICALSLLSVIYANGQQLKFYKKFGINDTLGTGKIFKLDIADYFISSYKSGFLFTDPRFGFLFKVNEKGISYWKKYINTNHPYYFTPILDGVYPTSQADKLNFTGSFFMQDTVITDDKFGPLLLQTDTAFNSVDFCYYISLGDTNLFFCKTIKTSDNGFAIVGGYIYNPSPP